VILAGGNIVLHGTPAELRRATGLHELEEIFMAAIEGVRPLSGETAAAPIALAAGG
jgi:ABC-type Na+ transport system ATPase subunit NatA